MSASTVAKHKCSVIYLDTGNSFSPQRIAHFVGQSSDYFSGNQVTLDSDLLPIVWSLFVNWSYNCSLNYPSFRLIVDFYRTY